MDPNQPSNQNEVPRPTGQAEDEDYQAASSSMATYNQTTPPAERSLTKLIALSAVAAILIAAIGAGVYWKFFKKSKPASTTQTSQTQQQNQQTAASVAEISSETSNYQSNNFSLSFDYPKDWTVTDTAGSGVLAAISPSMKLTNASGQTVNGQIVLKIRAKSQKLNEFDKGNALAVADSQKIAYTKPTQTQRGSTYVSFLRYASSADGLDGVYITGDSGYQKDQAIPLVDISKVDPVISITFQDSSGKPLTISTTTWNSTSFSTPLLNILKSFSIT